MFSILRPRKRDHTGYYEYSPAHVFTGGAAGLSFVGPDLMPVEDATPGQHSLRHIRFAPAIDWQPVQLVPMITGALNERQLVGDPLLLNDDPALRGVLPYF